MSSEVALTVRNLSKVYRIYDRPEHRLIQMATLGRVRRFKEFAALHDVSLEVRRGETVGIIGRNGCGKSTLLQIICGTLQPSQGSVEVHGRIAALLELGAGFNGEFTGRENVYMNGAILGFSREEMEARFEQIAQFAGIGEFIERPVKTYSSGMYVRLAFAVATAVEPDILIVDEALAVGDEAFQRKCFARIEAIKERGGTILFVSHGAQTIVQLCDRAVLLDAGEKLLEGEPKVVVAQYQSLVNLDAEAAVSARIAIRALAATEAARQAHTDENDLEAAGPSNAAVRQHEKERYDPSIASESITEYECRGARISNVKIMTFAGEKVNVLLSRRRYIYTYDVSFHKDCLDVSFGMLVKTVNGLELGGSATTFDDSARVRFVAQGETISVRFEFDCFLLPGVYFINAGVLGTTGDESHYLHRILDAMAFRVMDFEQNTGNGYVDMNAKIHLHNKAEAKLQKSAAV